MSASTSVYEEFQVTGENLLAEVRNAVDEGNVRRIYLKDEDNTTILEIPLATGVAATVITAAFMPVLVAVGAVAALLRHVTIGIERRDPDIA